MEFLCGTGGATFGGELSLYLAIKYFDISLLCLAKNYVGALIDLFLISTSINPHPRAKTQIQAGIRVPDHFASNKQL